MIAYGLLLHHGVPLRVDCTLAPALNCEGVAHYNEPGRCLLEAEKEKLRTSSFKNVPRLESQLAKVFILKEGI